MSVSMRTIVGWIMMASGICLFLAFPNSKDTDGPTTRNNSPLKKLSKLLIFGGIFIIATDPANWTGVSRFKNH